MSIYISNKYKILIKFMKSLLALATCRILFGFFKEVSWGTTNSDTFTWTTGHFRLTIRIFTDQLTFRFRAFGLRTLPITSRIFTYSFTFWFRCLTMSHAMGLFANCNAFWAVFGFTGFIRTFNFTIRFFTFNITDSIFRFLATSMAF